MPEAQAPRVFISYSRDNPAHGDRVLALADRLRADGIDAMIDLYIQTPPEGWPAWCAEQIDTADFVLMVCTETYLRRASRKEEPGVGHGVLWEGRLINQYLYDAGSVSAKFVPVLLADGSDAHVPLPVKGGTIYQVETPQGYESLFRLLSYQLPTRMPPLGTRRSSPPQEREVYSLAEAKRQAERAERPAPSKKSRRSEAPHQAAGSILWNPPTKMRVGRSERVEVRLGDADVAIESLHQRLQGRGTPRLNHLEIAPLMRVAVTAHPQDFSIRALSTQDQLVRPSTVARWDFDMTPLRAGLRRLRLLASMRVKVEGKDEVVDLPSYESEVRVRVAPVLAMRRFCVKNWQWIAGSVAIPLVVWAASDAGRSALKNVLGRLHL